MLAATFIGIVIIPPLYVFVQTLRERVRGPQTAVAEKPAE
jgi:HAE1 family hydrophobic/amphiphilic exporter-1/multidrug efflux pump